MGDIANAEGPAQKAWEIPADTWRRAEEAAGEIIRALQPTEEARERRRLVAEHVKKLVEENTESEVFLVGSVPQETYLPYGDIDMTAICDNPRQVREMPYRLLIVFEKEEKNMAAKYEVKSPRIIHAQVTVLNCLVHNIEIDISFNKLGALRKRCFIEKVLYRFLQYYSDFNWNNCGISLKGPVAKTSLKEKLDEPTENDRGDCLLSSEFLESSVKLLSVPSTEVIQECPMTIIDPLDAGDNLGRSVHIEKRPLIERSFQEGVRDLSKVFQSPNDEFTHQINEFFKFTRLA